MDKMVRANSQHGHQPLRSFGHVFGQHAVAAHKASIGGPISSDIPVGISTEISHRNLQWFSRTHFCLLCYPRLSEKYPLCPLSDLNMPSTSTPHGVTPQTKVGTKAQ